MPAHFQQAAQAATHAAAQAAGIAEVHLLQEPVAAALAYGIGGGADGDTVLVFDLGGGTFDVRRVRCMPWRAGRPGAAARPGLLLAALTSSSCLACRGVQHPSGV